MYKKYIAIDQYGQTKFLEKYPRKELMEYFGTKHADKIYRDINGISKHVGYVISGHWFEILKLSEFSKE
jgi:flagellar biosynthesis regulator FlbT